LLAKHDIVYGELGFGLINAFILGKVVSIGGMMRIGRMAEGKPLIVSTIIKAFFFPIWVAIFNAIELMIHGLIKTHTFQGSLDAWGISARMSILAVHWLFSPPLFLFSHLKIFPGRWVPKWYLPSL